MNRSAAATRPGRDDLLAKCWSQQDCKGCLVEPDCSWCPFVRLRDSSLETNTGVIYSLPVTNCFNYNTSLGLAYQTSIGFSPLLLPGMRTYARTGPKDGKYGRIRSAAKSPPSRP